jgi:four helix bundle protein
MTVRNYKDLIVWEKSVDLAALVYATTRQFPESERFDMTSQMRRAAVSISSNIAEGNGRSITKDYLRFVATANGSLNEVGSLVAVSLRVGLLSIAAARPIDAKCVEIGKMISSLRSSLRKRMSRAVRHRPSP